MIALSMMVRNFYKDALHSNKHNMTRMFYDSYDVLSHLKYFKFSKLECSGRKNPVDESRPFLIIIILITILLLLHLFVNAGQLKWQHVQCQCGPAL